MEAIVIGAVQGVAELFPVSSLGHTILIPAVIGGSWASDLDVSADKSPYLTFVIGLHVATAIALIIYFWRDWGRILRGLFTSVSRREINEPDQRLAWLLVLASIPVGVVGLLLERVFRQYLSLPIPTALFLALNGLVLIVAERLRRRRGAEPEVEPVTQVMPAIGLGRASHRVRVAPTEEQAADRRLSRLPIGRTVLIGSAQVAALLPGISRSGSVMVAGLTRGLSHTDAARFSFLLATPVILAAGLLKLPEIAGPLGDGIRPQILVGSLLSGVGAYVSVRFLTRYFETRSLQPFGIYCIVAGLGSLAWFLIR